MALSSTVRVLHQIKISITLQCFPVINLYELVKWFTLLDDYWFHAAKENLVYDDMKK